MKKQGDDFRKEILGTKGSLSLFIKQKVASVAEAE